MASNSFFFSTPILRNIDACAIEPRISYSQSRQSKEMDSVNFATSWSGPVAKRPLRETGFDSFTLNDGAVRNRAVFRNNDDSVSDVVKRMIEILRFAGWRNDAIISN